MADVVPGGTYTLRYKSVEPELHALVERQVTTFALDRLEVTTSRFVRFMDAYARDNLPSEGDGAHPKISRSGWDPSWERQVPQDWHSLAVHFSQPDCSSWDDDPRSDFPMGCLDWYLAFYFCIWDGGRLPTEAEWAVAGFGGDRGGPYPWSKDSDDYGINDSHACYSSSSGLREAACPVGAHTPGASRFKQEDMAGNLWEWTADWYLSEAPETCEHGPDSGADSSAADCQELRSTGFRVLRGGSFRSGIDELLNASRGGRRPEHYDISYGVRCARDFGDSILQRDNR